ncbi:hypothetical protein RvY_08179 [Ramazzottius varieornatus]|uniref:F-box domain-containing protein n=1 Tax=Ramazzottius varieornatus TaxID=947166 RepID=A0A1D1VE48_RAMVA|nr:hypothetical protein RvY_08179 [Ramazzottius varieornatus]
MPKRTNKKADRGTLIKRSKSGGKQTGTEGEMGDAGSPYGLSELFQRIPALVLGEIFDFLDAGQATRLGSAIPE